MKCARRWKSCPSARSSERISRSTQTTLVIFRRGNSKRELYRRGTPTPRLLWPSLKWVRASCLRRSRPTRSWGRPMRWGGPWRRLVSADLATFEGRFSDAVRILEQGAAADLVSKNVDRAAAKFAARGLHTDLARTEKRRQRGRPTGAGQQQGREDPLPGGAYLCRGRRTGQSAPTDRRPWLRTAIRAPGLRQDCRGGDRSEHEGRAPGDQALTDANGLLDTWIGHFELGRAYLEAGLFPQADSEFDRCIKRRGEALSLFLDEEPTYGYFPRVYYYQGRAREGLKSDGYAESYRAYLRIREKAGEDPLIAEVRRRAGSAT